MNNKQRKIMAAIFNNPTPKNLIWSDIEALFVALGCQIIEGDGSRIGFKRNACRADFHRPHPGKEAKPYQVRAAKEFLKLLGEQP